MVGKPLQLSGYGLQLELEDYYDDTVEAPAAVEDVAGQVHLYSQSPRVPLDIWPNQHRVYNYPGRSSLSCAEKQTAVARRNVDLDL